MLIQHYGKQAIDGDVNFDLCFPGFLAAMSFRAFVPFASFAFSAVCCTYSAEHVSNITRKYKTTTTMFFKNGTIQ